MSCQNLTIKLDEDEDVILEGSELFQALMNLGFTNFDSIPRVKRNASFKMEPLYYQVYQYVYSTLKPKIHVLQNFFYQEDKFIIKQMKTILKADILLDDHSSFINELIYKKKSSCSFFYEWFPLFGTITTSTLYFFSAGKYSITFITFSFLLGLISYRKFQQWLSIKNLRNLVMLQSELLKLCKNSLKILRQIWSNKPLTIDIGGKNKLIGYKKWNIINDLSLVLMELFVDHSEIYYKLASKILSSTQDSILINCFLTEIKKKKHFINEYDHLHNFYYMYILVQSEMIYILASAYYIEEDYFLFSKLEWFDAFINLKNSLSFYCFKLSKLLKEYKLSDTKPVRHIFRGVPNTIWQDTYIHLDLTSNSIQLAYKKITSILDSIDKYTEINRNNVEFLKFLSNKINEAFKEIENARNFAEYTSLLISKDLSNEKRNLETKNEIKKKNLLPKDSCEIVDSLRDELKIEDEVFEEYIKEEYSKPLNISSKGVIESFKLDKLLKNNLMTELKQALTEKQISMTERELRALKRMYTIKQRESVSTMSEPEICNDEKCLTESSGSTLQLEISSKFSIPLNLETSLQIPLPPPLPPPPIQNPLVDPVISKKKVDAIAKQNLNCKTIPQPKFEVDQSTDDVETRRFSARDHLSCNKLLSKFKIIEETLIGIGENLKIENQSDREIKDSQTVVEISPDA